MPNAQAQAKLQQLSAVGASNDAAIKAVLPLATQEQKDANSRFLEGMKQQGANDRANQRDQTTRNIAGANIAQRAAAVAEHWKATMATVTGANNREASREAAAFNRTMATVQGRQKLAETKGLKGDALARVEEQNAGLVQKQLDQLPELISKTEQIRDKADKSQKDHYDKVIQGYEKEMSTYQQMLDDYHSKHTGKGVMEHGESTASANATTVGTSEDDSDDSEAHTDPDDPIYN